MAPGLPGTKSGFHCLSCCGVTPGLKMHLAWFEAGWLHAHHPHCSRVIWFCAW